MNSFTNTLIAATAVACIAQGVSIAAENETHSSADAAAFAFS